MGIGEPAFTDFFRGLVRNFWVSEAFGLGFVYPPDWQVRHLHEIAQVAEGRLLTDAESPLNDVFRELADEHLPLITIAKPVLDDPVARLGPHEISPVITVHVDIPFDTPSGPFDLWNHVGTDLALFHAHIQHYRLLDDRARVTISGVDAVAYTCAYTVLHADSVGGCPAREQTIYTWVDPWIFEIRMCDYPERDNRLAHDFAEFIASIRIR